MCIGPILNKKIKQHKHAYISFWTFPNFQPLPQPMSVWDECYKTFLSEPAVLQEKRKEYSWAAPTGILQSRSPGLPGSVRGTQHLEVLLPRPSNCNLKDWRNTRLLGKLLFLSVVIDIVSALWEIRTSDCRNLAPELGVHKWGISL